VPQSPLGVIVSPTPYAIRLNLSPKKSGPEPAAFYLDDDVALGQIIITGCHASSFAYLPAEMEVVLPQCPTP